MELSKCCLRLLPHHLIIANLSYCSAMNAKNTFSQPKWILRQWLDYPNNSCINFDLMRRSQLAPSIVGEKGDDHGTRLHNSGKHNRNGSNDATDSQHRAKHFAIGIIVMCLSLFTCFHFFISAAVNKHSVFSTGRR